MVGVDCYGVKHLYDSPIRISREWWLLFKGIKWLFTFLSKLFERYLKLNHKLRSDSVYILFYIFSIFVTGYWTYFPVLYTRTLLFIHPIYTSLRLLTPNSQSIPPLTPSHLATTSLFFMFVSLFLFHGYVDLYHILFIYWIQHISDIVWYVSFSFWLTSLGVVFSRSIHAASNCLILLDVWIIFHG